MYNENRPILKFDASSREQRVLMSISKCQCWYLNNLEASHVDITLDGCTYPGQKQAQFNLSKKNI
jgi:hypothetical protein